MVHLNYRLFARRRNPSSALPVNFSSATEKVFFDMVKFICKKIENDGKPLLEETLLHAMGLELMLRTLIAIGEEMSSKECS
jgi:hypothetical protein